MFDDFANALNKTLQPLRGSPLLPAVERHLRDNAAAINTELSRLVIAEIPAFSESHNPEVVPGFNLHSPKHTDEMLRLLGGGRIGDFGFVLEHAKRSAAQRFPLEATLHAYRCVHKIFSRRVHNAIGAVAPSSEDAPQIIAAMADFVIEYTDAVSIVFTNAYLSQTRLLAEVAGDQRAELLTILLDGYDESDGRVATILRSAGYLDRRQSFCVALAQSVEPAEMLNLARARRLADSIDKLLHKSSARRLIDIRDNKVIIVFSVMRRISGWTAPNASLAKRITSELTRVGNAALIGVSNDVPSTSHIPNAYKEAALALEMANVTHRVVQISEMPMQRLILHLAGENIVPVLPAWRSEFFEIDDKQKGALVATLRAYADANMNVLKAAEILSLHPNTIYSRLQKIFDITDLNAKNYHALSELLIVADCRPQPINAKPSNEVNPK